MESMIKTAPKLNLKYSCSAMTKILHFGATRISRAPKSPVFKQISPTILVFIWLITCVKGFDTCFFSNDHANKCGLRHEGDRGKSSVRVERIITGKQTSLDWSEGSSPHMHHEARGEVEWKHLLKIQNL